MKIGILLDPYGEKSPGGLGKAIFLWARAIIENDPKNEYTVFVKKLPRDPIVFSGTNWRIKSLDSKYLWLTGSLRMDKDLDLYVFFTPVVPLFFKPKRSIVVALDFAYKQIPDLTVKDFFLRSAVSWLHGMAFKKASHIVAISHETKDLLKKYFYISDKKITAIHIGYSKIPIHKQEEMKIGGPFFLFAGVLKARKNVINIIKAFAEFIRLHEGEFFYLVIAGKSGGDYFNKLCCLIKELDITNRIIFTGYVKEEELAYLYTHAKALVFPSLIEGFGMPVLEAMDCGLPVITSNRGALAEVAGDSALLVDPEDINDIAQALETMAINNELRDKFKILGLERVKEFSWEKAASRMLGLIETNV